MKILVIRYRFIGDTLLTIPFLRNLRMAYPDAQIDMLIAPVSGEIIDKCPYVNNFIYFDTTKKHRYENKEGLEKRNFWSYIKLLKKEKYDKAYILKRSLSSAFLAFAAGIKERIGFNTENRGFLLTKKVPYIENKHEIECFLDVLRADGIEPQDNHLENWIDNEEKEKVKNILRINGFNPDNEIIKVIVHVTSGNRKKEWQKEKWAEIIEYLSNKKNVQVFFNGTKNDSKSYEDIMDLIKNDLIIKPINLCGCFNLRETLTFTSMCNLIVGVDSGNLHIAASVKVPVIGIYGPMNTTKWNAHEENSVIIKTDLPCQPCSLKRKCKRNYQCLTDISVDKLKTAIDEKL